MYLHGLKRNSKHILRSPLTFKRCLHRRFNQKHSAVACKTWTIKCKKFHNIPRNNRYPLVPIAHYKLHALTFTHPFCSKPSDNHEITNESVHNLNDAAHTDQHIQDHTPISERPDWVLIGIDDARDVFRLTNKQLATLVPIHKEDPYTSDRVDVESDVDNILTWYYLRDVWQRSVDIYGAEVVKLWYKRFKQEIDARVQYEALYGWQRETLLPQESALFKWLFSHKVNEILTGDNKGEGGYNNSIEGGGLYVVKRAIRSNASKLLITYSLYLYTSSYSLWAETLHAVCDLTNQGLLFLSIRLAATDPDWNHPYGYGASRWVVSFLSGSVLFGMGLNAMYGSLGAFLSQGPHLISDVRLGIGLCVVSGILELYSFTGAFREIKGHLKKEKYSLFQYLAHGTDSTSVHVFLEDGTGLLCSVLAAAALSATHYLDYKTVLFDVMGSAVIGGCLSSIGLVLMMRNAKLLSGRSVQNNVLVDVIGYLHSLDCVASYHDLKSMIVGMNTCVIKVEVNFNADKIAEKHIKTSLIFEQFTETCVRNDIESFHDLMMKSCADYQQWLVTERSLIEIGIKQIVKKYGYDSVHVDIETY
eukprot:416162_1